MTEAGIALGMFSLFGMFGGIVGGALTDRFGRKQLILFGLVFSALSTLSFGLVTDIRVMYPLAVVVGLIGSLSNPAHNAMIADILPEEKRQEGFGILAWWATSPGSSVRASAASWQSTISSISS